MGGGGLVILKHKSWNVWNRENLERVEKDEREHKESERLKETKKQEILGEIRHRRLQGEIITDENESQIVQTALADFNRGFYFFFIFFICDAVTHKRNDRMHVC